MSYLVVGLLLLLIVGGFITFLVMNATKRSDHATATDSDDGAPGVGSDDSPLGDTQQHAGQQDDGETVGGQDADESGGTGEPVLGSNAIDENPDPQAPAAGSRFQRDPVGGEAEARPFTETER